MSDAGQAPPPPKGAAMGARQVAAEIIAKDTSASSGRPGKSPVVPPRRRARPRIPSTVRGKLAIALVSGVLVGGLGYCVAVGDSNTSQIAGGPNCDCPHVDAGLLTKEYQQQCVTRETQLKQLATDDKLNLAVDANHKLVSGEFCDTVAAGPDAWPVPGAPETPPRAPPGTVCTTVSGIVRDCGN